MPITSWRPSRLQLVLGCSMSKNLRAGVASSRRHGAIRRPQSAFHLAIAAPCRTPAGRCASDSMIGMSSCPAPAARAWWPPPRGVGLDDDHLRALAHTRLTCVRQVAGLHLGVDGLDDLDLVRVVLSELCRPLCHVDVGRRGLGRDDRHLQRRLPPASGCGTTVEGRPPRARRSGGLKRPLAGLPGEAVAAVPTASAPCRPAGAAAARPRPGRPGPAQAIGLSSDLMPGHRLAVCATS
jgi:hypothetical protein